MTEAERVLAELAERLFRGGWSLDEIKAILAPYLPKPEPDRLTVAVLECWAAALGEHRDDATPAIRAIIAREVAAAEPSDEALGRAINIILDRYHTTRQIPSVVEHIMGRAREIRAALKGEGA